MAITLSRLNAASQQEFTALLAGTYEHSPWIASAAWAGRPFATLAALKSALLSVVRDCGREQQIALIRAHPELAGKAMVSRTLSAESTNEQGQAGLAECTPEEFTRVQQLNADYTAKFGWPFILAVRGPRGLGLNRHQIIETFARRLQGHPDFELAECLRNIHRIAELRLADKFGQTLALGEQVWDWAEQLALHSDPGFRQVGQLTVTYLTEAHRACAAQLQRWMHDCGFDEVRLDAVGNVVGVYHGKDVTAQASAGPLPSLLDPLGGLRAAAPSPPARTWTARGPIASGAGRTRLAQSWGPSKRLLTGSHFDTVRNGGKYDGRLGILVAMACVRQLASAGRRLPIGIEVLGFAEEEGQRYQATFLGSGALVGQFNAAWLDQLDADGVAMREAMRAAGLPASMDAITAERREPSRYLGFVEVHIEQGPVLDQMDLPLGVVSSINGSVRMLGEVIGQASHAGTTPMGSRRDAALAVAELALYVERRAAAVSNVVGTVGMLEVPAGSINVVPGRCRFSLDLRATTDAARDALATDVVAELQAICQRRGLSFTLEETLRAAAAPCAPDWQRRWEAAVAWLGLPVHRMPSGAGHDAMKLGEVMPQAMLFVRGGNSGISHNPLETITAHDAQLAVEAFQHLLDHLE